MRAPSLVKKVVGDDAMGVISRLIRSTTLASMLRLVRMRLCVWILDADAVAISVPAWGSTWLMFMKLWLKPSNSTVLLAAYSGVLRMTYAVPPSAPANRQRKRSSLCRQAICQFEILGGPWGGDVQAPSAPLTRRTPGAGPSSPYGGRPHSGP